MKVCSVCLRCFEDTISLCAEENHGLLTEARQGNRESIDEYRLEFLVGADEIGETYKAIKTESNQFFIVNIVAADPAGNDEFQKLFLRETRSAAEINHPHIVQIFESGRLSDNSLFVISEFVAGQTLSERLRSGKPLSEMSAVAIAGQAAEALEAIHAVGLEHRNIKPENIVLTSGAENGLMVKVKNIDFGKIRQQFAVSGVSDSGTVINDLKYFSPEQCLKETPVDSSTDVYSLGIVLYEMLAGNVPFDAADSEEIIHKQTNETPAPVQISNFDIRALLTHTLSLSLQKTVIARLKSANAFARQLRHIEQYASRSFSPAVSERISNDEKAKVQSDSRNSQIVRQMKETAFPNNPIIYPPHAIKPFAVSSLIENEESVSVIKEEEEAIPIPYYRKNPVVDPKDILAAEPKNAGALQDTKPVLIESEQTGNIPTEAEVLSRELYPEIPQPQLVTVEQAEKYLDDQMESLLKSGKPESASELSFQVEKETEEYEPDTRYNLSDLRGLISVKHNKLYIGGAAALLLLILIGVFLNRQSLFSGEQEIVSNSPMAPTKKGGNLNESASQPEKSEEAFSGNETAVVEMPDLPDSKTFTVGENQPVAEKNVPVISKSVNQNLSLKESTASAAKTNLKKSTMISKEKTTDKTAVTQNAFPDVKIIIGSQKQIFAKPISAGPDVFSRPRIVKKSKNLRVF